MLRTVLPLFICKQYTPTGTQPIFYLPYYQVTDLGTMTFFNEFLCGPKILIPSSIHLGKALLGLTVILFHYYYNFQTDSYTAQVSLKHGKHDFQLLILQPSSSEFWN